MLRNFLKIAIHSLLKRKIYAVINIVGLATGVAICLLIVLFLQSELSYDNFEVQGDHIYRVVLDRKYPGRSTSYAIIPLSIGEAAQRENPEILQSTRLFNITKDGSFMVRIGDRSFEERKVLGADSNFFRVFGAKLLAGDPATALQKPFNAIVTESLAKTYFGSTANAIGKSFESDNESHFIISGVCRDWPANSHIGFNMLVSSATVINPTQREYTSFRCYTYLLLNANANPGSLEAKFPLIIKKYVSGEIGRSFGISFEQFQSAGNGYHYYLQPLKKIHLGSDLGEGELKPNSSMSTVAIFSIVAIFILLIACINFINLSTARSVERAKEVGIRKTFGSGRQSIIGQFLLESVLISFSSTVLAIVLIIFFLPVFNSVSSKSLSIVSLFTLANCVAILLFSVAVGLIAGFYPAFVLSSFKPIMVLKGKFKSNRYGMALRNGLVVFQFSISVVLIICTIIVNRQMNYMTGDKLGFKKDHVIEVEQTFILGDNSKSFKDEVAKIPGIETVCTASTFPGRQGFLGLVFQPIGSKESMSVKAVIAGDQYASLLGLELKKGRFFATAFSTDSLALVLNEKAVEEMGLIEPIGARLTTAEDFLNGPNSKKLIYTVVGVMKDFHFQSLHQKISPLILINANRFGGEMGMTGIRVRSDHFRSAVSSIEKLWQRYVPGRPFNYNFLDHSLAEQYTAEQITQRIFTIFSVFAIFIACIGLMGLAAYNTQLRMREISIRKVLGASSGSIVGILSTSYLKLIILSALIAFPIAWWAMNSWLEHFAYRANMAWWIFVLAGLIAGIVALCTISIQAFRAAVSNPINSLRAE